ncbi:uncharacterized protein LOC118416346 [Branchiostoma floridae]|uniref:Uncharacterized protein LOC118416346 n=1 Tax=Branchiostoma floridae TaxID=7739 RepID=A0A9J7MS91_BRAFL|nr:uncharacterized protein LOC118416346 [Branchiostoma floridae]
MAPRYCSRCGLRATEDDNFCINCGNRFRRGHILVKDVDCSPYIHHTDISGFLHDNYDRLVDTDRRLLQEAMTLVTREDSWVMKNAQLTVYGKLMKVVFFSKARTNKYVVHLTGEDRPTQQVEEKGWKLKVRDGFKTAWGWMKNAAGKALGALSGVARLAIGW